MRWPALRGPWPGRLALVAVLGLLGGRAGLLVGLALAAYDAVRSPSPRELLVGSVVLLAAVPLAVLARGLPTRATLGPDVAAGNPAAHVLAGAGLALLVLGVLRDVRAAGPPGDHPGPPGDHPGGPQGPPGPAPGRALVLRRPDRPDDRPGP
jgi:hypothetical protein